MQYGEKSASSCAAKALAGDCAVLPIFIGLKFIGRTFILLLITGAVAFVCLWNYTTMFLAVIFAPAFLCYVHSSFIMRIFESLEKAGDEEIEDEKADNRIAQMKESAERI